MKIYQLQTPKEFKESYAGYTDINEEELMLMSVYAEHVAKKFAAECVNEALGNKMEVSNALHEAIDRKYSLIIWE